ncbi:MAG: hypothetical protein QW735_00830 [archaeon]
MGGGKRRRTPIIKRKKEGEKIYEEIKKAKKFPNCYGSFPDCPPQVKELIGKPWTVEQVPEECKICPYYKW